MVMYHKCAATGSVHMNTVNVRMWDPPTWTQHIFGYRIHPHEHCGCPDIGSTHMNTANVRTWDSPTWTLQMSMNLESQCNRLNSWTDWCWRRWPSVDFYNSVAVVDKYRKQWQPTWHINCQEYHAQLTKSRVDGCVLRGICNELFNHVNRVINQILYAPLTWPVRRK